MSRKSHKSLNAQAGVILHNFALRRFENLHHFWNLHNNFWFNTTWHRQSAATIIFCRRL